MTLWYRVVALWLLLKIICWWALQRYIDSRFATWSPANAVGPGGRLTVYAKCTYCFVRCTYNDYNVLLLYMVCVPLCIVHTTVLCTVQISYPPFHRRLIDCDPVHITKALLSLLYLLDSTQNKLALPEIGERIKSGQGLIATITVELLIH